MKVFGRAEDGSVGKTLRYFASIASKERGTVIRFSVEITVNHILRYVVLPLILSLFVQALITGGSSEYLYLLIGLGIITASASTYLNTVGFDRMFRHQERAVNDLTKLAGDAMNFAKSYQTFLDVLFLTANGLVVGLVAGLIVIGVMAPILLLPLALLLISLTLLNIRGLNQRSPYRDERKKRISRLTGIVADIMGNQLLTKVFARESYEEKQVIHERKIIEDVSAKEITLIRYDTIYRQIAVYTFQFTTLAVIAWLATHNAISVAALVFIVTYIMRTTDSMFSISSIIRQLEQSFLDATPMIKILAKNHDVVDARGAKTLKVKRSSIEFDDVTFSYDDAKTDAVFSHLNLAVPAGQRVGLAGPSGGGKTTFTKLLLRFADIGSGSISIDGNDISKVTQKSLREAISYVPQEPLLFHRSLRDNISYGKPDASIEEVIAAARKAHAMEFIDKLPNGLDTIVGERGVKLSGGQRQRVAIARAILKDAPILILDEATSALDSESEQLIQAALENLMKDRTSIVIAHRLSTIAKLDRIIVLDHGEIIEDGSHSELLAKKRTYARLWNHQSGGFIEE